MDAEIVKRRLFRVGFAILVGSLAWMLVHPRTHSSSSQSAIPQADNHSLLQPVAQQTSITQGASEAPLNANAKASASPGASARVVQIAPTRDQVRQEAEQNPHVTPRSLIFFAAKMAEKFKVARVSEQNARSFYQELEECLISPDLRGADSTQALCLRDAQRLALIYPDLHGNFEHLRTEASPSVRGLLSLLESQGNY